MKTVIEMAREAGIQWDLIDDDEGQVWYITQAGLKRLVKIVRADAIAEERKTLLNLVYSYASNLSWNDDFQDAIEARGNNA